MKLENVQALCTLARSVQVAENIMFGRLCIKGGRGQICLTAGIAEAPVGIEGSFVVDPERFANAVNACGPNAEIKATEKGVTIKGNGFRFNVRTMPATDYPWQDFAAAQGSSKVIMGNLTGPIATALPFGGDNPIQPNLYGVTLRGGFVYAANGPCGLRLTCAKLDGDIDLAPEAAKLIAWRGDEPTDYITGEHGVIFYYADGAALRLSKLAVARPPSIFTMLDGVSPDGMSPIPTGLAEAISTVAGFAAGKNRWLRLNAEGITYTTEEGEANYHAGDLPAAAVDAQQLVPMLKQAEKWAIDGDGKPLRFWSGSGMRGLVTQVRI